jgi:hypothetical protein
LTSEVKSSGFAVCQVDYIQTYLLNTVVLPACLMALVAMTWATNSAKLTNALSENEEYNEVCRCRCVPSVLPRELLSDRPCASVSVVARQRSRGDRTSTSLFSSAVRVPTPFASNASIVSRTIAVACALSSDNDSLLVRCHASVTADPTMTQALFNHFSCRLLEVDGLSV